jgi:hypothetical protein
LGASELEPLQLFLWRRNTVLRTELYRGKGRNGINMHCEKLPKPEVTMKSCNQHECKIRWRTGEWGKCNGCIKNPGFKSRVVVCVKQSPFEDSEVIIEESECKREKSSNKEPYTSKLPCVTSKRQVPLEMEAAYLEGPSRYNTPSDCHQNTCKMKPTEKKRNCKQSSRKDECCEKKKEAQEEDCDNDEEKKEEPSKTKSFHKDEDKKEGLRKMKTFRKDENKDENKNEESNIRKPFHKENDKKDEVEVTTNEKGLVVDKLNPEKFKILEIPMSEDVYTFDFSDEALENVAGNIASNVDMTKMKEIKGNEAQRKIQESKKENVDKLANEDDDDDDEYMEREDDDNEHTKYNENANENEYEHVNEVRDEYVNENEYEHLKEDRDEYVNENGNENESKY